MNDAEDLFDEYAAAYEQALSSAIAPSGENRRYFAERRVTWLKRSLDEMSCKVDSVLDFGCGDGATTPLLLESLKANSAVGADVSAKSLEIARKRNGSDRIRYESIHEFQSSGQMDLAYCNGVFHHILPDQRAAALGIVHRALRRGGLFSFWENNPWSLATRYVMSRCEFDRDAILLSAPDAKKLLRGAGFEVLRTDFRFIFPRALLAFRKIEDWVFRAPLGAQYQVLCRKTP
jgi:SAM-dependent methyltransferase